MIKLVASDLDGTIINNQNQCDPATVEQIKRIRKMGIKFAICTGRTIASMEHFLKMWHLDGEVDFIVGSNGGEIKNLQTGKTVTTYTLDKDVMVEIIHLYEPLNVIPTLYEEDNLYVQTPSEFTKWICDSVGVNELDGDVIEHMKDKEGKLMFIVKPEDMEKVEAFYEDHKDDRYIGFKTAPYLFEFNHPLLAKDVGIEVICSMMHINNEEVMAFGDTSNDVAMLKFVKYGIAMASGSVDAKEAAYDICPSIQENGFAQYLQEHLKTQEYTK